MSKIPFTFLLLFVYLFQYECLVSPKYSPKTSILPTPVVSLSPTLPNTNLTIQNITKTNYGDSQCLVVGDYYISYIIEKNSKKKIISTVGGLVTVIPTICPFYHSKTGYNGYASIALHKKSGIDSASFIVIAW
jgi:hypothetical protein